MQQIPTRPAWGALRQHFGHRVALDRVVPLDVQLSSAMGTSETQSLHYWSEFCALTCSALAHDLLVPWQCLHTSGCPQAWLWPGWLQSCSHVMLPSSLPCPTCVASSCPCAIIHVPACLVGHADPASLDPKRPKHIAALQSNPCLSVPRLCCLRGFAELEIVHAVRASHACMGQPPPVCHHHHRACMRCFLAGSAVPLLNDVGILRCRACWLLSSGWTMWRAS